VFESDQQGCTGRSLGIRQQHPAEQVLYDHGLLHECAYLGHGPHDGTGQQLDHIVVQPYGDLCDGGDVQGKVHATLVPPVVPEGLQLVRPS